MFTKLIFSVSRLSFGTLFSNSYLFPYFECVDPCFTHEQENLKNFKLTKLHFYRAIHTSLKILKLVHLGSLKDITDDTLYIKRYYDIENIKRE